MAFLKWTLSLATVTILFVALVGCQPSNVTETDDSASLRVSTEMDHHQSMNSDRHDKGGHDHSVNSEPQPAEEIAAGKSDMDKMKETLADLPEGDRMSAMKQHFCPVSDEMLGVMGAPEKIDVNGQAVWICCNGCKDKLLAEPDKYLAKINK
ncbi:hypothetical protein NZK35_06415 [Stieleria sp. ICT_E10.1]|uniref:Secreted protein n=1 Tax=Stieleria magnilauensis TaxID=2527963 RepID=A0ABX5XTM2_9BACT|nr:hypothetical protein [Stieleria sedimenti]MCS7466307.1 hypothetical protein [Stieleria sedimenti]QDV85363.1 hypothetical protein TBK1r_43430 [Planctomycetes bacterium TBK1r]